MIVAIPYKPRAHQLALKQIERRWNVWVIHRRAGKTVAAVNWLAHQVVACQHANPVGAYVAPFAKQAKAIAWPYFRQYLGVVPGIKFNESTLRIQFPDGRVIVVLGADNIDALRGYYFDAIVMDETAQVRARAFYEVVRPALADRRGSFLSLGTPKGRHNLFYELFQHAGDEIKDKGAKSNWSRALLTVDDTAAMCARVDEPPPVDAEELAEAERLMSRAIYRQEFHCSFDAPVQGAYYADELDHWESHITTITYDRTLPVTTAWDLGFMGVIGFFQRVGNEHRCFKVWSAEGRSFSKMVQEVLDTGYNFDQHIGPHDTDQKDLIDGQTRYDLALGMGLNFTVQGQHGIADGIEAVKNVLPRIWMDREACADLIEALRQYSPRYDELRQAYSTKPDKTWASDYCDMLRYYAMSVAGGIRPVVDELGVTRGGYSRERLRRRKVENLGVV